MNILVTGGAGYIGSALCWRLLNEGHTPIAVDNLDSGCAEAVPPGVELREHSVGGIQPSCFDGVDAVVHLAALSEIPKCQAEPALAYEHNTRQPLHMLRMLELSQCRRIVYASTAAVYPPAPTPATEDIAPGPTTPYGASKLAFEQALPWFLWRRWVALRFFNVCGASQYAWERPGHRTRLLGVVMDAARNGTAVRVNGADYPTPDGTCVRDYIHVDDVCSGIVAALGDGASGVYNLGLGRGYSIRELIAAVERTGGRRVDWIPAPRRDGDPAYIVADASKARRELGWQTRYGDLESMVETCWEYEPW